MHRLAPWFLSCLWWLADGSRAQVSFTATTWTALQAVAASGSPASLPPNTPLVGNQTLQSASNSPWFVASATMAVTVDTSDPLAPWLQIEDRADARLTAALANGSAYCGSTAVTLFPSHELLIRVQAGTFVSGAFTIDYQPANSAGSTFLAIDLGNDGTFDLTAIGQPLQARVPVVFGPGPALLRTRTGAMAGVDPSLPAASARGLLTIRFVPEAGCGVLTVAPACGNGPGLTAHANFLRGVDLHAVGLFPTNGLGALVLGTAAGNTPLPLPPGCVLHTDVVAWQTILPGNGSFDASLDLRGIARPASFRSQVLWYDPSATTLLASDTLQVICQ